MAGTYAKPKAKNHKFAANFGLPGSDEWYLICFGITSRGSSISENKENYEYMCGGKESEPTDQTVTHSFSGNRFIGDPAQDAILIDRLYDMDNRTVQVYEWYDNVPAEIATKRGNGFSYNATITITDAGSGDAAARENIGFEMEVNGIPKRGTVTQKGTEDAPTFEFAPLATEPPIG